MLKAAIIALCLWTTDVLRPGTSVAQKPASGPPTKMSSSSQHDPDNPANRGRARVNTYLDEIAATYTAKRATTLARIRIRAESEARQAAVRNELRALIGEFPSRTPLNARILGETEGNGFLIRKVIFDSQPNFPVTALLYLPKDSTRGPASEPTSGEKHPALLITPGHYFTGKTSDAGMAALFAQNGFIVLTYDPIGEGERLQYPDPAHPGTSLAGAATGEHGEASLQPMLLGDTIARYMIWDAMRGIDYLSALPDVDPKRIGAFGCSGGGTITALTGTLDPRIAAIGVACYITSFNALLRALGPQDAEQSSPRFLSSGHDFADLIEVAAPRPYAVISTYNDMFPFAGAVQTVSEARRFYALFDPASAGIPASPGPSTPPAEPTAPALNSDTTNEVSPSAALQFITGPGRHAALGPITPQILTFFMRVLEPGVNAGHPQLARSLAGESSGTPSAIPNMPKDAFQVTPTGQVATSYPNSETVFTLNRKRAAALIPNRHRTPSNDQLARSIRAATGAQAEPGASETGTTSSASTSGPFALSTGDGIDLQGEIAVPEKPGRHPAILFLVPDSIRGENAIAQANQARFNALAAAGNVVLAITLRPSPPGIDDMKSPILGPFYLLSLRADLVGKTLLGMRIDDAIRAIDDLSRRPDVDPTRISAVASGHMGLVLLHAAVLDPRLRHIAIDHVLTNYRSLLDAPLPIGAPEDVVHGVLLHYDIPDLVRVLGRHVTVADPLNGSDDLSQTSTPLASLASSGH
jgi:cephalosporin-C deacetylase-like acetyl esterase